MALQSRNVLCVPMSMVCCLWHSCHQTFAGAMPLLNAGKPDTPDAAEMPQGAAAVNWGFWQFFNDDGAGSSSSSEGDDNKDGVASHRAGGKDHGTWFRGRVLHYVPEQGCYWVRACCGGGCGVSLCDVVLR